MVETRSQKNRRLVRKMRESGRAYLRRKPGAFGGGIDPETGKRSSSNNLAQQAAARAEVIAAQQLAEDKAAAEAKIKLAKTFADKQRLARAFVETKKAQTEFKKILDHRASLIRGGVREDTRTSTNQAGQKLTVSQWRDKFGNRVERIKNLTTGQTSYKSFLRPTGGGHVRQVSGVNMESQKRGYNIIASKNPGKLIITLPNGRRIEINSTGRVIIGKALAGKKLEIQDGVLRKIAGRDLFKEKLGAVEKETRSEKVGGLIQNYASRVLTIEQQLRDSVARGDIQRLAELQRKKNLTPSERAEKTRLTNIVSKNYQRVGEMGVLTAGATVLSLGLAATTAVKAFVNDPKTAVNLLPTRLLPKIYATVKQDITRAGSGASGAMNVVIEYMTLGALFKIIGKGAKTLKIKKAAKNARANLTLILSPRTFNKISRTIIKPAVVLKKSLSKTSGGKALGSIIKKIPDKIGIPKIGIPKRVDLIKRKLIQDRIRRKRRVRVKKKKKELDAAVKNKRVELKRRIAFAKKLRARDTNHWNVRFFKGSFAADIEMARLRRFAGESGKIDALNLLIKNAKMGKTLSAANQQILITTTENNYIKMLINMPQYKRLKKLASVNRTFSVKVPKIHRLAGKLIKEIIKKIKNATFTKNISSLFERTGRKALSPVRKLKTDIKDIKSKTKKVVKRITKKIQAPFRKFIKRKLHNSKLASARFMGNKIKIVKYKGGTTKYIELVNYIYFQADVVAAAKAANAYRIFVKNGLKFKDLSAKLDFRAKLLKKFRSLERKDLETYPAFKKIKEHARLTNPYAKQLISAKRIKPVGVYFGILRKKLDAIKSRISSTMAKRGQKKRMSKRRVEKKKERTLRVEKKRKDYLNSNRYVLDKKQAKSIKIISPNRLRNINTFKEYSNLVDDLFNDAMRLGKVKLTKQEAVKIRVGLKKILARAIKRNDTTTLLNFKSSVNRIITEINFPSRRPDVFLKPAGKIKAFAKKEGVPSKPFEIKQFKPKTQGNKPVEIKSGGLILLQKHAPLKQISRTKQVTKQIQVMRIVRVKKKAISFTPMYAFAARAIGRSVSLVIGKSASVLGQAGMIAAINKLDSALIPITVIVQKKVPASLFLSGLKSGSLKKSLLRKKTILIQKKKKTPVRIRIKPKKKTRRLLRDTQTYTIITRRRGKIVKLMGTPMILSDARDTLAYSIDNNLTKSAWFVPAGKRKIVANVAKGRQGYFKKVSRKLRPFKIKHGKKKKILNGYIEKRKFFQDTKGETRAMSRIRKRKKVVRKKR